jgi:hypothetical protein
MSSSRKGGGGAVSRLFLSCDLIGSTAFKQRTDHDPQAPWQKIFLQFYWEFPQTLRSLQADPAHSGAAGLVFDLWKPVGDELIFTCEVRREADVYEAVHLWVAAMAEYKRKSLSEEILRVKGGPRLDLKGGAFIATFPGPDSESSIPRRPDVADSGRDVVTLNRGALDGNRGHRKISDYLFDYFGPSIDTGFRVVAQSSRRYFTLSLEVAYVLSTLHAANTTKSYQVENLVLRSGSELKGVWGGRTYPVFALDLERDDAVHQAFAKFEAAKDTASDVLELCKACYSSAGWPFLVYLPDAPTDGPFCVPPTDPLADYAPAEGAEAKLDDPSDPSSIADDDRLLS